MSEPMTPERMRALAKRIGRICLSDQRDLATLRRVVDDLNAEADRIDVDMPAHPFANMVP